MMRPVAALTAALFCLATVTPAFAEMLPFSTAVSRLANCTVEKRSVVTLPPSSLISRNSSPRNQFDSRL